LGSELVWLAVPHPPSVIRQRAARRNAEIVALRTEKEVVMSVGLKKSQRVWRTGSKARQTRCEFAV